VNSFKGATVGARLNKGAGMQAKIERKKQAKF